MASAIVRFRKPGPSPALEDAADHLGVPLADLDAQFGVQAENAGQGIWNVLLLRGQPTKPGTGEVFPNPGIATFGPPRP